MAKKGRVVIVGGSSGMGFETAKLLLKEGYDVTIASRSKTKLQKAKKALGKVEAIAFDMKNIEEVAAFFVKIDPFDHLVIPAADFYMAPFLEEDIEDARNYFDSKFWGQFTVAKFGAFKLRKGGTITFFSGTAAQKPMLNFAVGSAINAAIEGLTRALALELAPLRVNAISPGLIETPIWNLVENKKQVLAESADKLPLKKIGKASDIARVVQFLIECPYVTGTVVSADGGYSL